MFETQKENTKALLFSDCLVTMTFFRIWLETLNRLIILSLIFN